MSEFPKSRTLTGLSAAVLLLAACGASGEQTMSTIAVVRPAKLSDEPNVSFAYYDNGMRQISYSNEDGVYASILEFCDGGDLVEQTAFNGVSGAAAGNAPIRSVGHHACLDGKLTPEDFIVATP